MGSASRGAHEESLRGRQEAGHLTHATFPAEQHGWLPALPCTGRPSPAVVWPPSGLATPPAAVLSCADLLGAGQLLPSRCWRAPQRSGKQELPVGAWHRGLLLGCSRRRTPTRRRAATIERCHQKPAHTCSGNQSCTRPSSHLLQCHLVWTLTAGDPVGASQRQQTPAATATAGASHRRRWRRQPALSTAALTASDLARRARHTSRRRARASSKPDAAASRPRTLPAPRRPRPRRRGGQMVERKTPP